MKASERLITALNRQTPDRVPVLLKIWIDLAARLVGRPYLDVLNDPGLAMETVVQASLDLKMDASRLFMFPDMKIEVVNGVYVHIGADGKPLGAVDIQGGWATQLLAEKKDYLEDESVMSLNYCWHSSWPVIKGASDIRRMVVPVSTYYDQAGYGSRIDKIRAKYDKQIGLVGNINSATLAFYASLRGNLEQALTDFYDEPDLVMAVMTKGVDIVFEKAKFYLDHGIKILRYNDSIANMTVISPDQWRQFILPHIREVCRRIHQYDPAARIYCHICGNVLPIIADLAESGLDCIGPLDPLGGFSVADVRKEIGNHFPLMGGINTLSFIRSGVTEIKEESRQCMQAGGDEGCFILGSGCAMPRNAKLDNMLAVIDVAQTDGSYKGGRLKDVRN
jgi:uroporphyrinogen-III decarboxylase